ncbi:NAD(P)H-dependent FMN reductase LOT6 [Penicillium diatomitis]|uniref:NAD(P)H-dependent FMN reductase LOT6 n=1 Tax=Penicillium diatomitis TaxID=2819901 RepID=A0A9W9X1F9_9EURO|nr:NAD(P)H-dependent FMN reductase LOT6 [Penicillium diatomitis]KAJ5480699.1 NAD(P)H-dependent FMN reductase LOT6 [Penicillium diatomitis]
MPPKKIAIVTCSTRSPRLNPTITRYVHDLLTHDPALPTQQPSSSQNKASSPNETTTDTDTEIDIDPDPNSRHITFTILDLAAQSLPLYDESVIPASLPASDPTPHYTRPHTRAWSATVRAYDAFIFVTPQYNWSIPASLKNALDYLFHEWAGKPAGMVSYGSRGGGKATDHLRAVLTGLRMRVVGTAPALVIKYTGLPVGGLSEEEERVDLDGRDVEGWRLAGLDGMMRNLGMELVCELDKE